MGPASEFTRLQQQIENNDSLAQIKYTTFDALTRSHDRLISERHSCTRDKSVPRTVTSNNSNSHPQARRRRS